MTEDTPSNITCFDPNVTDHGLLLVAMAEGSVDHHAILGWAVPVWIGMDLPSRLAIAGETQSRLPSITLRDEHIRTHRRSRMASRSLDGAKIVRMVERFRK